MAPVDTTNALWTDDEAEQDSLFAETPPTTPPASDAPTTGTPPAIAEAGNEWTPPHAADLIRVPLADLFRIRADLEIRIGHCVADYDAAVLAITPPDGWPGKNAEQREQARAIAIAGQNHIAAINALSNDNAERLTRVKAEIMARDAILDEQKRAMNRLDSDLRARELVLRSAELEHARAVFAATHHTKNTDH